MGIRMTGLISGLDTESIIKQLMEAQSQKKVKIENKKTKLEWKQDKWKDLNTKLYKLYTDQVSNLRLQSSYKTRTIKSSNESAVTAKAKDSTAPLGSHTIEVKQLASSQYVTSGKLGDNVTASTKLMDLLDAGTAGSAGTNHVITIKSGEGSSQKENRLVVTSGTTIQDFVNACKGAGLNATFDAAQKRLFISSANSGKDNNFTIESGEVDSANASSRAALDNLVNYSTIYGTDRTKIDAAYKVLMKQGNAMNSADFETLTNLVMNSDKGSKITSDDPAVQTLINNNKEVVSALTTFRDYSDTKVEGETKAAAVLQVKQDIRTDILNRTTVFDPDQLQAYKDQVQGEIDNGSLTLDGITVEEAAKQRYQRDAAIKEHLRTKYDAEFESGKRKPAEGQTREEAVQALVDQDFNTFVEMDKDAYLAKMVEEEYNSTKPALDEHGNPIEGLTKKEAYAKKIQDTYDARIAGERAVQRGKTGDNLKIYTSSSTLLPSTSTNSILTKLGMDEITAAGMSGLTDGKGSIGAASVVAAADSEIILNGAELKGTTNSITANGIVFDISAVTSGPVTLSVSNDTQGTYDMIKNFIKEYNSILKEMNEAYYADSARGYEPLTDEEREAMTDDQVEKWEKKIKDSLLRRDDSLSSIISGMNMALMDTVEVDGKKYSLSSFGIQTSKDYLERGLLHIFGDKEDATYRDKDDKLMAALTNDPELVTQVFSQIATNLYDTMNEKMRGTSLSSALTFYNDKQMKNQITDYKKEIAKWETKLDDMENRYYKQFTAMEKAMAQLNSQSSYLTNMMGGGK